MALSVEAMAPNSQGTDPDAETGDDPIPPDVVEALSIAYSGNDVFLGEQLVPTSIESAQASRAGTQLTYGEITSHGLSKLLGPRGMDIASLHGGSGPRNLLELGSGRGRLALQAFLQYPSLHSVIGIELVSSRHKNGVDALARLCDTASFAERFKVEVLPADFELTGLEAEHLPEVERARARLSEDLSEGSRSLELRLGDFLELPLADLEGADVILLEVVMPPGPGRDAAHLRLCERLEAHCKHGCVVASYENLHEIWKSLPDGAPACPFHKLELCKGGYATSWSPSGHNFHGFRCDREGLVSAGPGAWL